MVFKILAIDGGGIRGLYPAYILMKMQKEMSLDYQKSFDLITGTSTGSIIAASLAIGYPIEEVVALYESEGDKIFKSNKLSVKGIYKSLYSNEYLKSKLREVFGNKKLSELTTKLIIPSTDISNGSVHVFKSGYSPDFVRDKEVKLRDAVLASCSAPMFFDPVKINEYLLTDGGVWANNPSLVAVVEALSRFEKDLSKIKLLSLGTGISKSLYDINKAENRKWGIATGWKKQELIELILNLQSQTAANIVKLLLPPSNYLRINFESETKMPLDKVDFISNLKTRADYDFSYKYQEIKNFLQD